MLNRGIIKKNRVRDRLKGSESEVSPQILDLNQQVNSLKSMINLKPIFATINDGSLRVGVILY